MTPQVTTRTRSSAVAASSTRRRKSDRESIAGRIGAMTVLVVLTIYFLIPIYWLVVSATKSQGDLASTFGSNLATAAATAARRTTDRPSPSL